VPIRPFRPHPCFPREATLRVSPPPGGARYRFRLIAHAGCAVDPPAALHAKRVP
jgi:hypothetical protein